MARLLTCGFELQSVTAGVEYDTNGGTGKTIDTGIKHSGAASIHFLRSTAGTDYIESCLVDSAAAGAWYGRFYLYIKTSQSGSDAIFQFINTAGFVGFGVALKANDTLQLFHWSNTDALELIGSASSVLAKETWYMVEFSGNYNSATSITAELKINGAVIATVTATNQYNDATTTLRFVDVGICGSDATRTGEIYVDDVAVNNTSAGGTQTGYPGAGSIVHMHPTAAGDAAATTGLYDRIDEVTPNDATDYIEQDSIAEIDYNFETSANAGIGASDTITLVQIGTRQHPESAAAAGWRALAMTQPGGTTVYGNAITHNDITWKTNGDALPRAYSLTSYVDPQGGGAWTPALLDTMQAGIDVTDATPNLFVSTIWALVEYVPVSTQIKKVSSVAYASIKKISGVAIASVKKVAGLQ